MKPAMKLNLRKIWGNTVFLIIHLLKCLCLINQKKLWSPGGLPLLVHSLISIFHLLYANQALHLFKSKDKTPLQAKWWLRKNRKAAIFRVKMSLERVVHQVLQIILVKLDQREICNNTVDQTVSQWWKWMDLVSKVLTLNNQWTSPGKVMKDTCLNLCKGEEFLKHKLH